LPVGLVVPHVSADDCSLSRLSRSGVRLIRQQMSQLLRHRQDWDATGTLECRLGDASELPVKLSAAAAEWSRPADPGTLAKAGCQTDLPAIWHAVAAWLKPAQLVRAWLAQDGVEFLGGMQVADLQFRNREWELLAADGCLLARADRVVLANAAGAQALLEQLRKRPSPLDIAPLLGMQSVLGQLSWDLHQGDQQAAFPAFPVNGAGSVIPGIPTAAGKAWFIGSSYGAQHKPRASEQENHASNFERLQQLLPHLASTLSAQFESGALQAWSSTRCVTADRLPLLGPLLDADDDGLWICAGMGSRGLTLSSLCAELLAAQWSAEPLPIEWSLATRLLASRGPSCTAAPTCKSEIKSG
jgi:tRNA 5-methylaminomethyl-2-thiouridine biosynthesis bifunctional protein